MRKWALNYIQFTKKNTKKSHLFSCFLELSATPEKVRLRFLSLSQITSKNIINLTTQLKIQLYFLIHVQYSQQATQCFLCNHPYLVLKIFIFPAVPLLTPSSYFPSLELRINFCSSRLYLADSFKFWSMMPALPLCSTYGIWRTKESIIMGS